MFQGVLLHFPFQPFINIWLPLTSVIILLQLSETLRVNRQHSATKFIFYNFRFSIHLLFSFSSILFCCPIWLRLPLYLHISVVLWPSEVIRHASEAPARLYLPASRPLKEGAPVHRHPAHLPRVALGDQDISCCYCIPHDGELTTSTPSVFNKSLHFNNRDYICCASRCWLWFSFARYWTCASPRES